MVNYKTIEIDEYELMLEEINETKSIDLKNFDFLIYCGGGQDKRFYLELKTNPKYEVLWYGWSGPKWSAIFSFIPGQAGLVRIIDQKAFGELYYEMASYSVSDAIYIPKELTPQVLEEARNKTCAAKFEPFVIKSSKSFFLTSETSEPTLRNGKSVYLYDYTLGPETDHHLKNILKRNK